ncbi:Protein MAIN-LIKE 1 [Glycine max]|nr:Protein MAIN-LIKE 1 [Glycine max]
MVTFLWMQPKHVSEHVWNGEPDKKLHIRRTVPTYQCEEQIQEEIVPLLRQSEFYWIMKMGYLKINATLISAFIERWRPETHTFHLSAERLPLLFKMCLRTDGAPLIVVETLQYMVSPQGRNTWTVDDLVPYVEKLVIISEEQERIIELVLHGPASEREFPTQEFHILQSSVETRGIGRGRESVEAEQYSQQIMERHHTDTSASEHSFGGVVKTQPHFLWPTMTPSQQHDAQMATPNAPFVPQ